MKTSLEVPRTELLVIGYGNTLRSDDAVGPRVAEAIEALNLPGVHSLSCALLTPELAEPISRARRVVFVDASVESDGTVRLRPVSAAASAQIMAHAASPSTLLALAQQVFDRMPPAWQLTIPVQNLELGEELSAEARRGLLEAIQKIKAMVNDA